MSSHLEIRQQEGIQTIRFARPAKKNAITGEMYQAMSAALDAGEADDTIVVHLFMGSPGIFTAGNDLQDFIAHACAQTQADQSAAKAGATEASTTSASTAGADATGSEPAAAPISLPAFDFVRRLPKVTKPMMAAVDGPAIGIGTTLLLHCDLIYASPKSRFATPFLDLGLVPEAGSSLLAQAMGGPRAFELLCLGEVFDAERAYQAGLINAIIAPDKLEAHAINAAKRLVSRPRAALRAARALMRSHSKTAVCAKIEEEAEIFARQLQSREAREAFAAFFARRRSDTPTATATANTSNPELPKIKNKG